MKKTVGLIFGGRSAEHDVSILSAANIIAEINKKKFRTLPIYITKCGLWFPMDPNLLLSKVSVKQKLNQSKYSEVILTPSNAGANLVYLKTRRKEKIDIVAMPERPVAINGFRQRSSFEQKKWNSRINQG